MLVLKRRAARQGHSVQQEVRGILARYVAEPLAGSRSRTLQLRTVTTGATDPFNREDFYDDER